MRSVKHFKRVQTIRRVLAITLVASGVVAVPLVSWMIRSAREGLPAPSRKIEAQWKRFVAASQATVQKWSGPAKYRPSFCAPVGAHYRYVVIVKAGHEGGRPAMRAFAVGTLSVEARKGDHFVLRQLGELRCVSAFRSWLDLEAGEPRVARVSTTGAGRWEVPARSSARPRQAAGVPLDNSFFWIELPSGGDLTPGSSWYTHSPSPQQATRCELAGFALVDGLPTAKILLSRGIRVGETPGLDAGVRTSRPLPGEMSLLETSVCYLDLKSGLVVRQQSSVQALVGEEKAREPSARTGTSREVVRVVSRLTRVEKPPRGAATEPTSSSQRKEP